MKISNSVHTRPIVDYGIAPPFQALLLCSSINNLIYISRHARPIKQSHPTAACPAYQNKLQYFLHDVPNLSSIWNTKSIHIFIVVLKDDFMASRRFLSKNLISRQQANRHTVRNLHFFVQKFNFDSLR